ncbi:MAG: hypothetical protein A3F72_02620 [Bacteroidetes bacterium RIFCSPLOWO2_12_FULL_35_15]|nr:MAG: hypothetical protein A3F72_02620 [Bacteroidetes bacterium RIFCSPLOWO2_12_FULL_35_15]
MKTLINPRTGMLAAMILSAGAWRLLFSSGHSPLTNFTPIGAMALFGGCYFADKWKAFIVPLLTLWLSDLLLNYFIYFHEWKWFYNGFILVYASFALMVVIGRLVKKVNFKNVLFVSVLAAVSHWVITDFGVWLEGGMYPKTVEGLITCYVAAIPYLGNMLIGNLLFGGIMFGVFELAQKKYPSLQLANA